MGNNSLKTIFREQNDAFAILIGNFDGVHLGHQQLIENFVSECKTKQLVPALMTFKPHPLLFLDKEKEKYLITSYIEKKDLLKKYGIEHIIELDFDDRIRCLSAKGFLEEILDQGKNLKLIYLGHDFKLGKNKEEAFAILDEINNGRVEIQREKTHSIDGQIVSSTYIRSLIKSDIATVKKFLGRNFTVSGTVIKGKGIGREQLVPTVNLDFDQKICIPNPGVYMCYAYVDGQKYEGITNIGKNPTIDSSQNLKLETHLFYIEDDFYGKDVKVEFLERIRNEKKFSNLVELKEQILNDIEATQNKFRTKNKISLALIGKNIQHSQSQTIYQKLLKQSVNYTLVDCAEANEIPSLKELSSQYQGVSITAPYKTHFIDEVELENTELDSINTLVFGDHIRGVNTDFLAIQEIFHILYQGQKIVLLGDGSMSKLVQKILKDKEIQYEVYSRKKKNLEIITTKYEFDKNTLVINTCAREFFFDPNENGEYTFWDFNYKMDKHTQAFKGTSIEYVDGMDMLEKQAIYALSFWNLISY